MAENVYGPQWLKRNGYAKPHNTEKTEAGGAPGPVSLTVNFVHQAQPVFRMSEREPWQRHSAPEDGAALALLSVLVNLPNRAGRYRLKPLPPCFDGPFTHLLEITERLSDGPEIMGWLMEIEERTIPVAELEDGDAPRTPGV